MKFQKKIYGQVRCERRSFCEIENSKKKSGEGGVGSGGGGSGWRGVRVDVNEEVKFLLKFKKELGASGFFFCFFFFFGGGGGQDGCERRIKVFVKIQFFIYFYFFWGGSG